MGPEQMATSPIEGPWFREFLEAKGFAETATGIYSNGRASIRQVGTILVAVPGDGIEPSRNERFR